MQMHQVSYQRGYHSTLSVLWTTWKMLKQIFVTVVTEFYTNELVLLATNGSMVYALLPFVVVTTKLLVPVPNPSYLLNI